MMSDLVRQMTCEESLQCRTQSDNGPQRVKIRQILSASKKSESWVGLGCCELTIAVECRRECKLCSHRTRESTKELVRLLPKQSLPVRRLAENWLPRFQQPQRPAQPAPAKARGVFHNRPTAVQRGNVNNFRHQMQRQKQKQKPQAKPQAKQQP
ncbi:UNVERIFIED_CONTAM: hypothetical protein FKN15_065402 [Acipenser sinensis]